MSLHLEDWPHIGAFNYRMKGFSNQTCHHYFKHYQRRLLEMTSLLKLHKSRLNDYCMGAKKRHKILLDLMLQFKREYNNLASNLAIMHYVENSHDSNERFNWVDNDLYTLINKVQETSLDFTLILEFPSLYLIADFRFFGLVL